MSRIPNGTIPTDGRHVSQLLHQLSDTERQLLLSRQLVKQLEKIRELQTEISSVSTRLIFETDNIDTEEETSRLYDLKNELKKYEQRFQMLKKVDNNGPQIDVQLMPCTKIRGNKYRILDREVSITKTRAGRSSSVELIDSDEETVDDRSRHWSGTTATSKADNSQYSGRIESVEDELRELSPRRKRSGRRTIIPERFASFPMGGVRNGQIIIGLIAMIVIAFVAITCFKLIQTNETQLEEYLSIANRYVVQTYDRVADSVVNALSGQ